ncbi:MAG: hypothetical protein WAW11_04045 [Patescibacteria group bacterium]
MNNNIFELVKEIIDAEDNLSKTISKGALKLDDNQIETVSFVFWLCYMAEKDLDSILKESWNSTKTLYNNGDNIQIVKFIKDVFKIKTNKIDVEDKDYTPNNTTFGDRIFILEQLFGKIEHVNLLWKLKKLRDDVGHGRIEDLKFNEKSLLLKEVRSDLLMYYFTLNTSEMNLSKSKIWSSLSNEEKEEIKNINL